jgi:hypothetical protein
MKKFKGFAFWIGLLTLCLLVGLVLPELTSSAVETKKPGSSSQYDEVEKKWGIRPLIIRLTGAGHFLEFRYMIVDAEKAKMVMYSKKEAILKDQETGDTFPVMMSNIGSAQGTITDPKPGRRYLLLFANPDKGVTRGKRVSVIIDSCRVEDLKVE